MNSVKTTAYNERKTYKSISKHFELTDLKFKSFYKKKNSGYTGLTASKHLGLSSFV